MVQKWGWLVCVLLVAACSGEPEVQREPSVKVEGDRAILSEPDKATFLKTEVVRLDQGSTLRLPGRLVWNEDRTVRVFPQVGGRVQRILVEVGDSVKAGQALAVLSSPDFGVAEAENSKAEADLAVARKAHARSRELFEAGVIAAKDWEQSEADLARAQAEAQRAARRLSGLGGSAGGDYRLVAPIAGVVVERNLNPGLEFRPDQASAPLFVVTDPSSLWVQMDASERDLGALQPGRKFALEARQYPGEKFVGQVKHVADFVDPTSRTIKVRGELANKDRRLKGEMFVEAQVDIPVVSRLLVPAPAVLLQGDKRYVFVAVGAGVFERREVTVVGEGTGDLEVSAGVAAGEKVVVEGNLHLGRFFRVGQDKKVAAK